MDGSRTRRATDRITSELLELIRKEDKEPEKGVLLILYQMSELISDNAELVKTIDESITNHNKEFAKHKEESLGYLNKAKGAGRVLLTSIVIFKVLMLSILSFLYSDYKELKTKVQAQEVSHTFYSIKDKQEN